MATDPPSSASSGADGETVDPGAAGSSTPIATTPSGRPIHAMPEGVLYELWDDATGRCLDIYETRAAALAGVAAILRDDPARGPYLGLITADALGVVAGVVASGDELVALVEQERAAD